MSQNIILNKSHILNTGNGNNILRYDLPKSVEFSNEDTVSLSNLNVYFSWFNITAKNRNNFFQYKWFNTTDGTPDDIFDVIIEDGYYSVSTLNEYILSVMTTRGHYLETQSGSNYIYFFELRTNSTYYATSIKLSSLSNQYDFNDSQGLRAITDVVKNPSTWVLPNQFEAPSIIIPSNNNFGSLIGFSSGTIEMDTSTDVTNRSETFLNAVTPNMMPSSSYILTCNLVSNELSIPDNVFFSFTVPNNVGFGDMISPHLDTIHSKIKAGLYTHIEIRIFDQNFQPLIIKDADMLLNLSIFKK
jgi:hypothetical protein